MPAIAQNPVDGQVTPAKSNFLAIVVDTHALGPAVGSVEVRTWRRSSTATQSDFDGQEIPKSFASGSKLSIFQVGAAAPGSVETTRSLPPLAAQNENDGQETALSGTPGSALVTRHVPFEGSVEATALPN
jgi:hypothetical protein